MKPNFTFTIDFTSILQSRIVSFFIGRDENYNSMITLGVFLPDFWFFLQLAIILFLQACICALVAIVTYFTIIKQEEKSIKALLSGYAIIIPTLLHMPFWFIPFFQIKNICLIFAVLTTPILTVFRSFEAMYGTCPFYAQKSLIDFIAYYAWVIPIDRDQSTGQAIRLSWSHIQGCLKLYLRATLVGGVCYSLFYHKSFQLYPIDINGNILQLFHWKHLVNNFILAYLLFNNLLMSSSSIGLVTNFLSGCKTISIMNNPLTSSTSPSNFWGGRWNLLVHGLLKRGVYIPIRKNFPKACFASTLGVMMTFLASGLIHEYVVYVFLSLKCQCFDHHHHNYSILRSSSTFLSSNYMVKPSSSCCNPPVFGNALFFFLWNGILVFLERCFKLLNIPLLNGIVNTIPSFVLVIFVIMTSLPIAHWFTDPYLHSNFFHDAIYLFPVILSV